MGGPQGSLSFKCVFLFYALEVIAPDLQFV